MTDGQTPSYRDVGMHPKRPPGQLNAPAESLQVGFYKSVTDRSTDGWADRKMDWPIYGLTPSYARCDYVFKNEIIEPKMPALFIDKGWPNLHYLIRSPCLLDRILTTSCGSRGRIRRDYQSLVISTWIIGSFKNMEQYFPAAQLEFSPDDTRWWFNAVYFISAWYPMYFS